MNLSCCICIFVITNFVLGSSNKNLYKDSAINKLSRKKSGLGGSNSVAVYEPEADDENTDVEANKDDDGDANKDDDGDANKDDDGDANKDDDGDANKDDDGDANKDDDGDANKDDDGDANKDDDGDANKDDDGDANKDDDGDANKDDNGDANKDDDGDAKKDDDGDANKDDAGDANKDDNDDANKDDDGDAKKDDDGDANKDDDGDANKDDDGDANKDDDDDTDTDDDSDTDSDDDGDIEGSGERFPFRNGIVPYYVDRDSYDEIIVDRIVAATKIIEKESCIKFVRIKDKNKTEDETYFLHFVNPLKKRECEHSVTRTDEGNQTFTLGYDCMQMRDIIHTLMHVLGFRDEVTHPLRDSYVRVLWENIQLKYRSLFLIKKSKKYEEESEYDMMSIMHFYPTAYSINGAPTIIPLTPGELITPSNQLSFLDKKKLRSAFKHACNRRKVSNLIGNCINAIQGDDTAGCTGGETDNGGGSSKFKSGASSEIDKNMNLIGIGEDKKQSLIGTDNDKIEKDRIIFLSGTDKDKKEALSGSDRDKIQVLSGTDKDRIQVLSGSETDKVGRSKIRLRKKSKNQMRNLNLNINKKTSTVGYLRSYRKYMY